MALLLKKHLSALVVCSPILLAPSLSYAGFPSPAEIANAVVQAFMGPLTILNTQSEANLQMSNNKSSLANKAVIEGVAEWQMKESIRRENVRLSHSLVQPETTCGSMAAASVGPAVDSSVKTATFNRSSSQVITSHSLRAVEPTGLPLVVRPLTLNDNGAQQVVQTYNYAMSNFCTPDEDAAHRCGGRHAAAKYPGGDMRPELLFTDSAGNDTIAADQDAAVDAFINNLTDSISPETLRNPAWENTVEGRKYVIMVRQYIAYMNLAKFSLQSIETNHLPIASLGDSLLITADPRFANRHNISRMEAADLYIKTKWSPESVKDLATATDSTTILRDIAMMTSYRLWIEYQQLSASEREESLLAGQVALLTRQVYSDALVKQKEMAVSHGNSNGAS